MVWGTLLEAYDLSGKTIIPFFTLRCDYLSERIHAEDLPVDTRFETYIPDVLLRRIWMSTTLRHRGVPTTARIDMPGNARRDGGMVETDRNHRMNIKRERITILHERVPVIRHATRRLFCRAFVADVIPFSSNMCRCPLPPCVHQCGMIGERLLSSVRKYSVFIGTESCTTRRTIPTDSTSPSCLHEVARLVAPLSHAGTPRGGGCLGQADDQIGFPFRAYDILRDRHAAVRVYPEESLYSYISRFPLILCKDMQIQGMRKNHSVINLSHIAKLHSLFI